MTFVIEHLSSARLAPKLIEQVELPPRTRPEVRLLRLIARVPGLQKLGQVLARHRGLRPALRTALSKLENGIRDVAPQQMHEIIRRELGPRLDEYKVKVAPGILSEASVSAVLRLTWQKPHSQQRQRAVFKVLKPYIPECYAEDMQFLHDLAAVLGTKYSHYGFAENVIPDTFNKVRRLLQHEVDLPGEQATLKKVGRLYQSTKGIRVPQLIAPLCTTRITAMSEEAGVKVTSAIARMPRWKRRRLADQVVEAVVALPLCSDRADAIFHADPHAGNMLYDSRTGELVLLDWALTEYLTRKQRRHLAMLFLMLFLRNPVGVCRSAEALREGGASLGPRQRENVGKFISDLPLFRPAGPTDAMALLERLAGEGVLFPSALVMLSKVLFTLDGVLEDVAGAPVSMAFPVLLHVAEGWVSRRIPLGSPLRRRDWLPVETSTLMLAARLYVGAQEKLLHRYFPSRNRRLPAQIA
jgi:ubiquinone biosynthesis protein